MGLTVQMHQLIAYRNKKSTWRIKEQVLGWCWDKNFPTRQINYGLKTNTI
jgi:hypothetical protein